MMKRFYGGAGALVLLLSSCATMGTPMAQQVQKPGIEVQDQGVAAGGIVVDRVSADTAGWLVVKTSDAKGNAGATVGFAPVEAGTAKALFVPITLSKVDGQIVFISLLEDKEPLGSMDATDPMVVVEGVAVQSAFLRTAEQAQPMVVVADQSANGKVVMVDRVVLTADGWLSVRADDGKGNPKDVIGSVALAKGSHSKVSIPVDAAKATMVLFVTVHEDKGTLGTFEFPGTDTPALVDTQPVMAAFLNM